MGCCNSRKNNFDAEYHIQKAISRLCFFKLNSEDIIATFNKKTFNLYLSRSELSEILSTLQLPYQEECRKFYNLFLETPNRDDLSNTQKIFMIHSENQKFYSVKKLKTLGILLGNGKPKSKFILLYDTYSSNTCQISRENLRSLIYDVLDVTYRIIPQIAILIYIEEQVRLTFYKNALMLMIKENVECFENLYVRNDEKNISKKEFVDLSLGGDLNILLKHSVHRIFTYNDNEKYILGNNNTPEELAKLMEVDNELLK